MGHFNTHPSWFMQKHGYKLARNDLSDSFTCIQSGAAVTHMHGNVQDVGSNPAVTRKEKRMLGRLPVQKVEDHRCQR